MPRSACCGGCEHLHHLLADPDLTSVRMVLALEKLSIAEARRSFTYFHLFGYPSDLVIANRVLPDHASGFFEELRATQQRYLPVVESEFGPVPVRTVPQFDREMVGGERLRELGRALYGDEDPTVVHYRGRPYSVRREAQGYVVSLELPFASKEAVSLSRDGDELIIGVGSWRRSLLLPRALINARTKGARMDGHLLQVEFEPRGGR